MRNFITSSLLVVSALAFAGCAVQPDQQSDESTEAQGAELAKAAKPYVAIWNYSATGSTEKFYDTLTLNKDASYVGIIRPTCTPGMACPQWMREEHGTWKATASTLTLRPEGATDKKVFASSVSTDGGWELKISDKTGIEHFRRLAHEGEHCGGFTANAFKCEPNLVCSLLDHNPDVGGTCVKPALEGESCGFRTQTVPCADGLECKHVSGPLDALTCAQP